MEFPQSKRRRRGTGAFPLLDLPPELLLRILIVGDLSKDDLTALKRTNVKLWMYLSDPAARKDICRALRDELSLIKSPMFSGTHPHPKERSHRRPPGSPLRSPRDDRQ